MQKRINLVLAVAIGAGLVLGPAPVWALEDTIVAVVNNDIITQRDLIDYYESAYFQLKSEGLSQSEIDETMAGLQKTGIKNLIEDRIMLSEANRIGLEVRRELIDKKLADIQKQYASEQDFLDALLQDGNSVTDLRNKITDQLKIKYLIEEEVKSKIFVNPQEVTDYYKANVESFKKPERMDLDSVYIPFDDAPADARAKAEQALAQLKEGKDFAEVAKEFSKSASIGILAKGETLPEIENAVMSLNEGEISSIVEVKSGLYIFKVKKKLPAETSSIEEVKKRIYDFLFQKKYKQRYLDWLEKLKKNAYISIKQ
jgi:parvulin-like peptidyl-prolyl isomerase